MAVISCEVGEPLKLVVDLKIPGVDYTTRMTTPVVLIEALSPLSQVSKDNR